MGVTFFDIFRPADAYQDGWNDCAREASAMLADERRRHREVVAKMREKKRRRDIRRQFRGESGVDDRLHYRYRDWAQASSRAAQRGIPAGDDAMAIAAAGLVAACNDIIDALHKNITAAESAPVAPSDWFRACEISDMAAMAPPSAGSHMGDWALYWDDTTCAIIVRSGGRIAHALVHGFGDNLAVRCHTPADLTAALNRLAAERKAKP